jgi:hypothetical protein
MKCNPYFSLALMVDLDKFQGEGNAFGQILCNFPKCANVERAICTFEGQVRGLHVSLSPPRIRSVNGRQIPTKRAKLRLFVQIMCNLHDSPRHEQAKSNDDGPDDAPATLLSAQSFHAYKHWP